MRGVVRGEGVVGRFWGLLGVEILYWGFSCDRVVMMHGFQTWFLNSEGF